MPPERKLGDAPEDGHWRYDFRTVASEATEVKLEIDDLAHERMARETNPDIGKIYPIPRWFTSKRTLNNTQPIRGRVYQVVLMSDGKRLAIEDVGPASRAR